MKSKNKTAAKKDELVEFDMSNKEMARIYESSMETIGKKSLSRRGTKPITKKKNGTIKLIKTDMF